MTSIQSDSKVASGNVTKAAHQSVSISVTIGSAVTGQIISTKHGKNTGVGSSPPLGSFPLLESSSTSLPYGSVPEVVA